MVQKEVAPAVDSVDYISVVDADTLVTLSDDTMVTGRALMRAGRSRGQDAAHRQSGMGRR